MLLAIVCGLAGMALLGLAAVDGFLTVLSLRGAGPLTGWWTRAVWSRALRLHQRRSVHHLLSVLGPAMVAGVIICWYLLLLAGWFLVYLAAGSAIIVHRSEVPADFLQTLHFVGNSLSGVGYGDLVPRAFPWTLVANFAAFTATFLITTSLSYLMPVLSAAVERRHLAQSIFSVGRTPVEVVRNSWTEGNGSVLNTYWTNLFSAINQHAQKGLSYPALHYFHSPNREGSSARAILVLADALFLIGQGAAESQRPPAGFLALGERSVRNHARLRDAGEKRATHRAADADQAHLSPQTLRDLDIEPVGDAEFNAALERYRDFRAGLSALCRADGW